MQLKTISYLKEEGYHLNKLFMLIFPTQEAIDVIVEIMRTTRNENVKLGAAKVITDKSIADQKSIEVGGLNGQPIQLNIITGTGFLPPSIPVNASSEGDTSTGQPQVQDNSLASQGQKDDNSNNGTDQASAS